MLKQKIKTIEIKQNLNYKNIQLKYIWNKTNQNKTCTKNHLKTK